MLQRGCRQPVLPLTLLQMLPLRQWQLQLQTHQLAQFQPLAGIMPQVAGTAVGQTLLALAQTQLGGASTVAVGGRHTGRGRRRLPWGQIQVLWARALEACLGALAAKLAPAAARLAAVLAAMQRRLLRMLKLMCMHIESWTSQVCQTHYIRSQSVSKSHQQSACTLLFWSVPDFEQQRCLYTVTAI